MTESNTSIESVLQEQRVFQPPAEMAAAARIGSLETYRAMAAAATKDPDGFWGEAARRELHWFEPFHTVLDWSEPPFARWFEGGTTNLSYNCLDRHLEGAKAEKLATEAEKDTALAEEAEKKAEEQAAAEKRARVAAKARAKEQEKAAREP